MARIPISAFIKDPKNNKGPYTYHLQALNACSTVTFYHGDNKGVSEITVSSSNPAIKLFLEFDESKCSAADVLAEVIVTVDNGDCMAKFNREYDNPCKTLKARICPNPARDGVQEFMAQVVGGNYPFTYEWIVKKDGVFIEEGECNQLVKINRKSHDGDFKLCLKVTDSNGCSFEEIITVPSLQRVCPEVKDITFHRRCSQSKNIPRIIDVVALASDADGTIDLSTIEITTVPVCGDYDINYAAGIITYVPTAACVGIFELKWRVKDNNGNWSPIATAKFIEDPCDAEPIAVDDTVDISCDETVRINILGNDISQDADIELDSIEIIAGPSNGTYETFSNGELEYSPNPGLPVGSMDYIYYRFSDVKKQKSTVGVIVINITTCCSDHDAALEISCTELVGEICIDATAIGNIPNLLTDNILVDSGNGYTPGTQACFDDECGTQTEIWIDDEYTNEFGIIDGTQDATVTATRVSTLPLAYYLIEYTWPAVTSDQLSQAMVDFIDDCNDVIQIGNSNVGQFPFRYDKNKFRDLQITETGFSFEYLVLDLQTECESVFDSLTGGTEDLLDTLDLIGDTMTWNLQTSEIILRCIDISATASVKFKRLITRSDGCDQIELEYLASINLQQGCSSIEVSQISGPVPGDGSMVTGSSYTLCADGSAVTSLDAVYIDGSNVLNKIYDITDANELAEAQQFLQTYGEVYLVFDNEVENKLIINVIGVDQVWNYVLTNGITTNFTKAV